jgi:hypothetical protein
MRGANLHSPIHLNGVLKHRNNFILPYQNLCMKPYIQNKLQLILNVNETRFPLNNISPKIVATEVSREVVNFISVERVKNVATLACHSASGVFIPPFVICKRNRFRDIYKQNLPTGHEVTVTDFDYINEGIFMEWTQHF